MIIEASIDTREIQLHYDKLSVLYRLFWGNHIHHGYWEDDESTAVAQAKLIQCLASFAGVRPGSRVLDVGCGMGGSSVWLAREMKCSVLGLTLSPAQAEIASGHAQAADVSDRVTFEVQDANHLNLEQTFDVVWVIECSEHLHDKFSFIRTTRSLLKPGGTLAVCTWLISDDLSPAHRQLVTDVCTGMLCPSLVSREQYEDWMRAAGFNEIRSQEITRQVVRTWDHCRRIARRPEFQMLLRTAGQQTRRFVATFDAIHRAYAEGAMRYGMFAAQY